ncbi:alcohol acetyltransferase-domain-containing protein [Hypoxylon trugodes]|uniref:alcohol acetyltransferase-domain-containing protein n=1 Tax=Hypoxylon trugodes TaxID=326681 RepID=UPI00219EE6E5|nr:alcohol acetyltransferase-domain-containing protein [Hypoxylon trugodes]KAI1390654.1 alcohol acetyltransferase-domain-containing protein [Hypoxylon trugodes]
MPNLWPRRSAEEVPVGAKLLRRLGRNEAYQLALYVLDQYRGTTVSCRYAIPSNLKDAQREKVIDTVNAAISDNVLKHPVLQVGIANADTKKPIFVQLDSLDLRRHVNWRFIEASADSEATLQELIILHLDTPFPNLEEQPGWRIVVLHQDGADFLEILFAWNHPNADGMSGKIFHQSLIESLNAQRDNNELQTSDWFVLNLPNPQARLPPPLEQIMELPLGVAYLFNAAVDDNKPQGLLRLDPTLAHWAPITTSSYKTQFRSFTVENGVLSKVLTACRQYQTTLTGLLHGLTLASLASHLGGKAASGFQAGTTINTRRFVPPAPPGYPWLEPEKTMGNFVTQIHHTFHPEFVARVRSLLSPMAGPNRPTLSKELAELVWDAAAKVRREVADKLELGVKNDVVGAMKFVNDWISQQKKVARRPRQSSWMITGLGVLDGGGSQSAHVVDDIGSLDNGKQDQDQTGVWKLRRAQFALGAETLAAALMVSPMTAAGEQLCVGGSWQDGVVEEALGERVMADLERWMGEIGGTGT